MEMTLVAKQPKEVAPDPADPEGKKVSSWKGYHHTLVVLRKIGAHLDVKQEDVLALFEEEFDNFLATLQAEDEARRKKKSG